MTLLVGGSLLGLAATPSLANEAIHPPARLAARSKAGPVTSECILTYKITRGNGQDEGPARGANMRIRDTVWGLGDGTWALGPGELTLRVPSDGTGQPTSGRVEVLDYRLVMNFTVGTGVTVTNRMLATARHPKDPTRAVATGHLRLDRQAVINWLPCAYPSGYDEDEESYTPDVIAYGPGCLAPYQSVGNVHCDGMLCWAGDLEDGDNPQLDTWEQALEPLVLEPDLSRFRMDYMLVPNRMPSRTFVSLEGRLVSSQCR